ncbi:MAG: methyl-accepting chemotaxis protein, partial [Desulfobulbaceae bacterium]|nr:methyl-accepting chemotaxis protein [Desulfobulbaceae bacterium]
TASKKRVFVFAGLGLGLSVLITIYIGSMMHGFNKTLNQMVHRLHESAQLFLAMSQQLLTNVDRTEQLVESTNHNIVETTENISSLAASSEEINAAIFEISSNSVNSAGIAKEATDESIRAAAVVDTLKNHADSISGVSKLISSIAFQTKLLALNANVEAARAGEAGAGFAIVANEVKTLAQSANNAAEEINNKITTIQEESKHTSEVMKNISSIIHKISENSSSIAASVEEESAVVSEISNRISGVSSLAEEMSSHIQDVSMAARDTKDHAVALQHQAETLSAEAEELDHLLLKL